MVMRFRPTPHRLYWLAPALLGLAILASAQQTPAPSPPSLLAIGQQATDFVIRHEIMDPRALVPATGKPLGSSGAWSVGNERPSDCPPGSQPCVLISYRVPDGGVSCEWVVLLKPDGTGGVILQQNLDSIRYLLRVVPPSELAPFIVTRSMQLETRAQGTAEVSIIVGTTGEPTSVAPLGNTASSDVRDAALTMAKQWVFKPLRVGNRAIPFQTNVKFFFSGGRIRTEP